MANVGDTLTEPETGWKRIDDTDSNFKYEGTWVTHNGGDLLVGGTHHVSYDPKAAICFNFTGNKIRIICTKNNDRSPYNIIKIDGTEYHYQENALSIVCRYLVFEKDDLGDKEHSVEILHYNDSKALTLDAIDIIDTGDMKPYNPQVDFSGRLLRITLIDSSDHDYQLSVDEIAAFVKWYNGYTSTDAHAYALNKKIGSHVSMEYVAFEKIISFEVV